MDCVEGMKKLPDNSIDMCIFSPPYDKLRDYEGKPEFDLHATGIELYRILKEGSICAMVIQDQTKDFAKSLTSFRTIVDWCDNIGFRLFECCIYYRQGTPGAWWSKRFRVDHEYIPLFLKGKRPAYFNKEPLKVPTKHAGTVKSGFGNRKTDGTTTKPVAREINKMKCRGTVWDYATDTLVENFEKIKKQHPATFPDQLPYDIIQCFCPEGGIVVDSYMGSGSTAIGAVKLNRNFIGFDVCQKYVDIAEERIRSEKTRRKAA